ncbi:Siderophore biosynthesis non-ribosomal peptide synthetase modules @ Bacillibactin synthetase component F [Caballeronia glathei]|uniref:Non-ribosomal peptide synthetase modules n=1 Tax=Caballeronia glathei TaxID=60547 RepID=A0A069PEY3_9BURK|nr:non-ribosomal peptide synthetase [Caballeronia glathei]KDR39082.1 Non-ribosomal peptide synthetase modules [Caballeronia glathei]CDY78875.1 Siderophore biosynthesis non-ribosomal peptide synthetase modules @ Bacillibactin synthetase component F [Caballeronia glathei]
MNSDIRLSRNATDGGQASHGAFQFVHESFVACAHRIPHSVAVTHGASNLSYAELDRRSNQLAHHLMALGVGPDTIVGLSLDRSIDLVVSLLGIFKAGGAYLSLDPNYPRERLKLIIDDARPKLVLTRHAIAERLPLSSTAVVALDRDAAAIDAQTEDAPGVTVQADHLAYVLYTSGSTGRPKGVLGTHRSVAARMPAYPRELEGSRPPVYAQKTTPNFIDFLWEVFMPLTRGERLAIVAEEAIRDPRELIRSMRADRVTHIVLVPSLLRALIETENDLRTALPDLTHWASSGERLPAELADAFRRAAPHARLVNIYGTSEFWDATAHEVTDTGDGAPDYGVPIGRTIGDMKVHVLDESMREAPDGVAGELYVAGPGVARGYLGHPGLTAERFIPSPFVAGERLYRTGDRGRRLASGTFEFVGRVDNQVKLRGFRVELGEIENALTAQPDIKHAVVVTRDSGNGDVRLGAYIVLHVDATGAMVEFNEQALKAALHERLPSHMVPDAWMVLPALPLTPNGKYDRQALPAWDSDPVTVVDAGASEIETEIARVFAKVLGRGRIGIRDNFFEIGGHSLLAMRLVSQLRNTFKIDLPIARLFETPTIAGVARYMADAAPISSSSSLTAMGRPAHPPLSFAQQRLWFLDRLEGPGATYNLPVALRLHGQLDTEALKAALGDLLARHDSLRTAFSEHDDKPYQHVLTIDDPRARVPLDQLDASESTLAVIARQSAAYPFDLAREIPIRATLIRVAPAHHVLLVLTHHIASDGWSLNPLIRDLGHAYSARAAGRAPNFTPLPVQYIDYTLWQRAILGDERNVDSAMHRQSRYWQHALDGLPPCIDLPTDRPRPPIASFTGAHFHFHIPGEVHVRLKALARSCDATLFMVLHAALALVLSKLGAGDDIAIGSPIAGRTDSAVDDLVGFFVNMIVLRSDVSGNPTVAELIGRVRERCLAAYAHQDLPFERLVEIMNPARTQSHHPLVQVTLALQNNAAADMTLAGLTGSEYAVATDTAKFDLTVELTEDAAGIAGVLEYATDLFDRESIERIATQFARVLAAMTSTPQERINAIDWLAPDERERILVDWNNTAHDVPNVTLVELFEQQAARDPKARAVVFEGESLSFGELNERANRLAHHLRALGIGREDRVGLCLPRSPESIVAMIGILKAGAAYLPLDPDYPAGRLQGMLDKACPKAVVTNTVIAVRPIFSASEHLLKIDTAEMATALAQASTANPPLAAVPEKLRNRHPAYVIFTSGSTGAPKGVIVTHRELVNHMLWMQATYPLTAEDRVLGRTSISFDAAGWEIWLPLISGAQLQLASSGTVRELDRLAHFLVDAEITVAQFVPSMLETLLDEGLLTDWRPQMMFVGGEALSAHLAARAEAVCGVPVVNLYGPTEATIQAMSHPLRDIDRRRRRVPIGRPIWNTRVYVLDDAMAPVPVGTVGEVYIAGAGLARGYLNRPDLTADRFVPCPFDVPGSRMYRTGDLARWHADGVLDFEGRADEQIKVRGFRIEPGEIEATLAQQSGVGRAVVLAHDDGSASHQLVAYVTSTKSEESRDPDQEIKQVEQWQEFYESIYAESDHADFGENFDGWTSSYSGEAILLSEMRQWRQATVDRILELKPARILEIGVGSGLLLSQLASKCEAYWATDFSSQTIATVKRHLQRQPNWAARVKLHVQPAHVWDDLPESYFDTIVINSVIQYFPSAAYLVNVIEQAVERLAPGGSLFIGDVRNLHLHRAFATATQLARFGSRGAAAGLRRQIERAIEAEKELLLAPEFFSLLPSRLNSIGAVDIQVKRGGYSNELSRYRYDVVLRKGPSLTVDLRDAPSVQWGAQIAGSDALRERLARDTPAVIRVTGVPHEDLAREIDAMHALDAGEQTLDDFVWPLSQAARSGHEIGVDAFHALAGELGYRCACTWSASNDGTLDIVLWSAASDGEAFPINAFRAKTDVVWSSLSNTPLRVDPAVLRHTLAQTLPEYMVPSAIIVLDRFPIMPNGKIDRRALPRPTVASGQGRGPQTPREQTLLTLFCEVLGLQEVFVDDNFFDLGGHSLLATRLVNRIRTSLGITLTVGSLFDAPTVSLLARQIAEAGDSDPSGGLPVIAAVSRDAPLPLSFAQERLWLVAQVDRAGEAYHLPLGLRLEGTLERSALLQALGRIVARHEVLRTAFVKAGNDGVAQQIAPVDESGFPLIEIDLRRHVDAQEALQRHCEQEATQPFDLERGCAVRGRLLRQTDDSHVLLVTMHHIASDGLSMHLFAEELATLYSAFARGEPDTLPALPFQYADYSIWQRQWLRDELTDRQRNYWRQTLAGAPALINLPTDRPRPLRQDHVGDFISFELDAELTARLRALGRRHGMTLYMTVLAGWALLLSRLAGQQDIVIGTTSANRGRPELDSMIGLFVDTLVLRMDLSGSPLVGEWLERVRAKILEAQRHHDIPFQHVVEIAQPVRSLAHSPLFQVMYTWQNALPEAPAMHGLEVGPFEPTYSRMAKFDLTIALKELDERVVGEFEYATALFDRQTIERYAGYLRRLLAAMVEDGAQDLPVTGLALLGEAERNKLLYRWNVTEASYPRDLCTHQLFEQQAERSPHAIAIIAGGHRVTYRELDSQANQLAHHLRELGVGPDTPVALLAERTLETVVGLIAILKAGGAYVPVEPSHPTERQQWVIEDSGARIMVVTGHVPPGLHVKSVVSIAGEREQLARQPSHSPASGVAATHLAYIIYTSGSTGLPKGVMVEHRNLMNYLAGAGGFLPSPDLDATVHAPVSFDLTNTSFFPPLMSGRSVTLLASPEREMERLAEELEAHPERLVKLTPSHLKALLNVSKGNPQGELVTVVGGEPLTLDLVRAWRRLYPRATIINHYGPTETTVGVCTYRVPVEDVSGREVVPIGRPIGNTRAYVLDVHREPVPTGVVGELYIGGDSVARGYRNRADLTAERFLADPFRDAPNARMYRTGDLVRYLSDGNIEFAGRSDDQVKIRGYRVELGEVEARLSSLQGVRQAAVIAYEREPGDRHLAAYVVPDAGMVLDARTLRAGLLAILPEYMVPAAYVVLQALPTTPNGKLNRAALPAPERHAAYAVSAYEAPQGEWEEAVAAIWAQVLRRERVGRHDDFFALGGHSLLAIQVLARVREMLKRRVTIATMFAHPVLSRFAAELAVAAQEALPPIGRADRAGPIPLSFAQQRLWFLSHLEGGSEAYNVASALSLTGTLDRAALHDALTAVVERHEVLRTVFDEVNGRPFQRVLPTDEIGFHISETDLRMRADIFAEVRKHAADEARAPFDFKRGPLIRAQLLREADDRYTLLITMHHMVSDGWSTGIFARDLSRFYEARVQGNLPNLPALPVQYADYAVWQRQALDASMLRENREYWQRTLRGSPVLLELPLDRPRPARQDYEGDAVPLEFGQPLTDRLKALSLSNGVTLHTTVLSAWATVLGRLSGQSEVVVGAPVSNRSRTEVENLIGFFVNTVALRIDLSGEPTSTELLQRVKTQTVAAQEHQDFPFEQVVEALEPERSLAHSPIFQVMFAWQNTPQHALVLPELEIMPGAPFDGRMATFDLTLALEETEGSIAGELVYATSLFDRETVERYGSYLHRLLDAMVAENAQSVPIASLPMLAQSERNRLIHEWTATSHPYPSHLCIHEQFELQVERTPDAVALVHADEILTYRELNKRANRLAHYLRQRGIRPDDRVAICIPRGFDMIVALLATLKAGAAYVPLDPAYPPDRLTFMFNDSSPSALLTQHALRDMLTGLAQSIPVLELDGATHAWEHESEENLGRSDGLGPRSLAYVIYTSGSTGQPKGVAIEHQGLANLTVVHAQQLFVGPESRVLQFASFSFDGCIFEVVMALCQGASLYLHSHREILAGDALTQFVARHRISHAILPPSVVAGLDSTSALDSIKTMILSGDRLPLEIARRWSDGRRLINGYGPTEATVCATLHDFDAAGSGSPRIGKPIVNKWIYILDRYGEPAPIGATGEIYIGGNGIAREYLNRPDLTAMRFVPDPFASTPDARMYRTGDLGRWTGDGEIEFMGRNDDQVKIRGLRIEPGEIETQLAGFSGLREVAVIAREDRPGDRRLVAYYTSEPSSVVHAADLAGWLRPSLPEHMIPAAYVRLDELPLTPNGKLDRHALPVPDTGAFARDDYEPPEGELEVLLASLWAEMIGIERVGRRDDFFSLGGHSLLAVQLVDRATRLAFNFTITDLFEAPTIERLSALIASRGGASHVQSNQAVELRAPTPHATEPLFLVPDGTGSLLYAHVLAPFIDSRIPLYGLPSLSLPEGHDIVERWAQAMLPLIRKIQPEGPYRIAGWSFGGMVAYEIGLQLLAQGETVSFIGLLDSSATIDVALPDGNTVTSRPRDGSYDSRPVAVTYRASTAPLPVCLFVAKERLNARQLVSEWTSVVSANRLSVVYVDGTHHSMIQPPNVCALGHALGELIARHPDRIS